MLKDLKGKLEDLKGLFFTLKIWVKDVIIPVLSKKHPNDTQVLSSMLEDVESQLTEIEQTINSESSVQRESALVELVRVVNDYRTKEEDGGLSKAYDVPVRTEARDRIIITALKLAIAHDEPKPAPVSQPKPSHDGLVKRGGPYPSILPIKYAEHVDNVLLANSKDDL